MNTDTKNTLTTVYKAIDKLSEIEWLKKNVRDIRSFRGNNIFKKKIKKILKIVLDKVSFRMYTACKLIYK
jgi:virulence-associated protein VapD